MTLKEQLEKIIPSVDAVTFDVFDTAIRRKGLRPEELYGFTGITGLERRIAEKLAYWLCRKNGKEEIQYSDILRFIRANVRSRVQSREFRLEKSLAEKNPEVYEAWELAIESGKTVAFISDMYLPESVIREILLSCGYDLHDTKVFVSSEVGMTKRRGSLYSRVRSDLAVDYGRWAHIGDNVESDVLRPQSLGIKAIHLCDRHYNGQLVLGKSLPHTVGSALGRLVAGIEDQWFHVGHDVIGPLLSSFSIWLEREALKDGCELLLFLARDGWLLWQAYRELDKHNQRDVKSKYAYVSRSSVTAALSDPLQGDALRDYLRGLGVNPGSTIGVVDVGWNGSIQRGLQSILNKNNVKVHGYYLATKSDIPNGMGYISNARHPLRLWARLAEGIALVETVMSAPHGRVRAYAFVNGKGRPVFESTGDLRGKSSELRKLRHGAKMFARRMLMNSRFLYDELENREVASAPLLNMIVNPDLWSSLNLGSIIHGQGIHDEGLRPLAQPIGFSTGIKTVVHDVRSTHWSVAALKLSVSERVWPALHLVYRVMSSGSRILRVVFNK